MILGLLLGAGIAGLAPGWRAEAGTVGDALGGAWLAACCGMTTVPLVFALLFVGGAVGGRGAGRRLAAIVTFAVLLVAFGRGRDRGVGRVVEHLADRERPLVAEALVPHGRTRCRADGGDAVRVGLDREPYPDQSGEGGGDGAMASPVICSGCSRPRPCGRLRERRAALFSLFEAAGHHADHRRLGRRSRRRACSFWRCRSRPKSGWDRRNARTVCGAGVYSVQVSPAFILVRRRGARARWRPRAVADGAGRRAVVAGDPAGDAGAAGESRHTRADPAAWCC